ncbi:PaaI family thioesterase [Amorphus sp. MBR-141]
MADDRLTKEALQTLITRAPFHQWLGLEVQEVAEDHIVVVSRWREEFVVNPEGRYTHGGILATLIDVVADYALAADLGKPVPTIDLRVDYHRAAMPGDLTVTGRIVRAGGQFATVEATVADENGKLLASGRGTYFSAAAKK